MQPKVPDPVDQTEDTSVPGNKGTVTQGTNQYEQINYEVKYRKVVHRCETVPKELMFLISLANLLVIRALRFLKGTH